VDSKLVAVGRPENLPRKICFNRQRAFFVFFFFFFFFWFVFCFFKSYWGLLLLFTSWDEFPIELLLAHGANPPANDNNDDNDDTKSVPPAPTPPPTRIKAKRKLRSNPSTQNAGPPASTATTQLNDTMSEDAGGAAASATAPALARSLNSKPAPLSFLPSPPLANPSDSSMDESHDDVKSPSALVTSKDSAPKSTATNTFPEFDKSTVENFSVGHLEQLTLFLHGRDGHLETRAPMPAQLQRVDPIAFRKAFQQLDDKYVNFRVVPNPSNVLDAVTHLHGIRQQLADSRNIAVLGPGKSGKSTLIRSVFGQEAKVNHGPINVDATFAHGWSMSDNLKLFEVYGTFLTSSFVRFSLFFFWLFSLSHSTA
jgi:hypothetical protein